MQPKFSTDEKVLCYHGPLLYEAKILKSKKEGGNYSYFVHYQGWNKNWDEWVGETRIMKQAPESYEKQKKLQQNHAATNKAQKKAAREAKKKKGGSDSGANSRASTPVGDRSLGVTVPRQSNKRSLADDERSNSSRPQSPDSHYRDDEVSNPASISSTPLTSKIPDRTTRGIKTCTGQRLGSGGSPETDIQGTSQGDSESHNRAVHSPPGLSRHFSCQEVRGY